MDIDLDELKLYSDHVDYNLWYFLIYMCGGDPNEIKTIHFHNGNDQNPTEKWIIQIFNCENSNEIFFKDKCQPLWAQSHFSDCKSPWTKISIPTKI